MHTHFKTYNFKYYFCNIQFNFRNLQLQSDD
nr:MAG TPA: hypothetical protein [Caudoviricetes sp.]